jgi:broad specificity phosphatase PhoE
MDSHDPQWETSASRPKDPPLSPIGQRQAMALADHLAGEPVHHIFVSQFVRTLETAYPLAERLNLPIKVEWGLSELLTPEWFPQMPTVLTDHKRREQFPRVDGTYENFILPKYPETWEQMDRRVAVTVKRLLANFEGSLLLVGHGASISGVLSSLLENRRWGANYCGLYKVLLCDGKASLEADNDRSYLPASLW